MAVRMDGLVLGALDALRWQPVPSRVRGSLGGAVVVDSARAALVWEPRRVVPTYAAPPADVTAGLIEAAADPRSWEDVGLPLPGATPRPVLDPSVAFAVHTAAGTPLTLRTGGGEAAAFRLDDPDLPGWLLLDFAGFDAWWEEDEPVLAHPRDPFHRVDALRSSRQVVVELDGVVLARSDRPLVVLETMLPPRSYLPREDVTARLVPSAKRTRCPYKGLASSWSLLLGDRLEEDVAWSYEDPVPEAPALRGRVAFYDERVDVVVDGVRRERPLTPWSPRPRS
ncbi:DUF427 domain-containing protein [Vallicoccus soli]